MSAHTTQNLDVGRRADVEGVSLVRAGLKWKESSGAGGKTSPKQSNSAPGGGHHGTVVSNSVLGRDVVLQEQALGVLLLQSVPLSNVLSGK